MRERDRTEIRATDIRKSRLCARAVTRGSPNPWQNSAEFSSRPERHKSDMTPPCRQYEIDRVYHLAQKYFTSYAAAAGSERVEIFRTASYQAASRISSTRQIYAESNTKNGEESSCRVCRYMER